ncbi:YbbR-like domain-containing protein [Gillisia sp. M10.2A]|uniref:YbbR-like domain-containing protein n=1 Tax=Gillisia lutea TaxID=2909668 RepID=A0ABS9EHJ9_9FLAO|nr:YbbR-like domain-containing protein [Gillisia lutea]MCF4100938.1 YbbR-like domain-containing protein [Gillisia lutea]
MQDKIKIYKPLIKKGPLKTFLFFLGFSAFIWVIVQFSKDYTESLELPLQYVNVDKDKIILANNPDKLEVRIREKGFNIAWNKLFPPVVTIDISDAIQLDGMLLYDLEKQKAAILSQLNVDYNDANFLQNELKIHFQQRAVKKIKVQPNIELGYAVGYSALGGIQLSPDSVRVSGPENILDTLSYIYTKALKLQNISKDIKGKVKLDTSGLGGVTLFQNEINYASKTDKFTEGQVDIPIELVNVPANTNVVIFPKQVKVYYQVSLNEFDNIKANQFRVIANFKDALDSDGYVLAEIVQQPALVNNVRLNKKKIQFVIKR